MSGDPSVSAEGDLFRQHFERLPGAAFIWRRDREDFRIIAYNRAAAKFGDNNAGKVVGRTATELAAYHPNIGALLCRCAELGEIIEEESDHRFTSGLVRRVIDTFVPLSRDIVVVHGQDVTEQRAMERRLRESEARLRALVEAIPDSILRMDADARIIDAHYPKALDPPPWRPEELIGRTVGDFYGPDAQERQAHYNRKAIRTGEMQVFEIKIPAGAGTVNLESRVVRIDDNEVVITSRDISERVALERRQTIIDQRERSRLGREIHDGLAQTLIGADLQLRQIGKRLEGSGSRGCAADISSVRELIGQAIAQARDLARGLSPIPDGTTLFEALRLVAKYAEEHLGIRCDFRDSGSDRAVGEAAVTHLYRVAKEAITNAARHGSATAIELGCVIDDRNLVLSIADNGTGMPADRDGTAGLGLRIMRHRARAIGGEIRLAPSGNGAGVLLTCVCTLPTIED